VKFRAPKNTKLIIRLSDCQLLTRVHISVVSETVKYFTLKREISLKMPVVIYEYKHIFIRFLGTKETHNELLIT
jgi:hypothetical protein